MEPSYIIEQYERNIAFYKNGGITVTGGEPLMQIDFLIDLFTLAKEKNIPCQISLEEKMGCGLGVCLGCAVEVVTGGYEHVCKQGPVFDSNKVII